MAWRAQVEPVWRQTEQFKRVDYRRVELASARLITVVSEWPEDLRWVVEAYLQTPSGKSARSLYSPRFIVAQPDKKKLVVWDAGLNGWNDAIVPALKKLVGS